jgi:hypothetical protein
VIKGAQASDIYLLLFCVYQISAIHCVCLADLKQTKKIYGSRVLLSNLVLQRIVITVRTIHLQSSLRDFPFKLKGSVLGKKVNLKGGTVFDPEETGRVVPNELLMAFSMSMKGTGNKELKL